MPSPYSEDLRLRVVNAVESGKTTREVGTLYQVSPAFVSNIHQYWQQTGHVHPKKIGGYRRAFLEPYEQALKAQLADHSYMVSSILDYAGFSYFRWKSGLFRTKAMCQLGCLTNWISEIKIEIARKGSVVNLSQV